MSTAAERFERRVEKIPGGVNPAHLEPVTDRENLMRGPSTWAARNSAKTHCDRGHAFNESNTYKTSGGSRLCKVCRNENKRRYRREGRIK